MEKKISNAFTYMFNDKDWILKFGLIVLLYMPTTYLSYINDIKKTELSAFYSLILFIVSLISIALYIGYLSKFTNMVINFQSDSEMKLPDWKNNFKNYFILGLKRGIALFLLGLVFLPLVFVTTLFTKIFPLFIILFLVFVGLCITSLFIFTALDNIFCTNFSLTSYFQWSKAFNIINTNMGLYLSVLGLGILLTLFSLIFEHIKLPVIIHTLISSIYIAYSGLVYAYLTGIISKDYIETTENKIEMDVVDGM